MIVKPFEALRPQVKYVKECAALPYDVMSSDEARKEVDGKPYSFLHIDKAEIDLDPTIDICSRLYSINTARKETWIGLGTIWR